MEQQVPFFTLTSHPFAQILSYLTPKCIFSLSSASRTTYNFIMNEDVRREYIIRICKRECGQDKLCIVKQENVYGEPMMPLVKHFLNAYGDDIEHYKFVSKMFRGFVSDESIFIESRRTKLFEYKAFKEIYDNEPTNNDKARLFDRLIHYDMSDERNAVNDYCDYIHSAINDINLLSDESSAIDSDFVEEAARNEKEKKRLKKAVRNEGRYKSNLLVMMVYVMKGPVNIDKKRAFEVLNHISEYGFFCEWGISPDFQLLRPTVCNTKALNRVFSYYIKWYSKTNYATLKGLRDLIINYSSFLQKYYEELSESTEEREEGAKRRKVDIKEKSHGLLVDDLSSALMRIASKDRKFADNDKEAITYCVELFNRVVGSSNTMGSDARHFSSARKLINFYLSQLLPKTELIYTRSNYLHDVISDIKNYVKFILVTCDYHYTTTGMEEMKCILKCLDYIKTDEPRSKEMERNVIDRVFSYAKTLSYLVYNK